MPEIILPFGQEKNSCTKKDDSCSIISLLSKETQLVVQKNPHLLEYLHMVPINDYGVPQFHTKLNRSMSSDKKPNLIYPVKDGIFTHIIYDASDGRNTYIPIEPVFADHLDALMLEVESRLLDISGTLNEKVITSDEEKRAIIVQCLDRICTTNAATSNKESGLLGKMPFNHKVKPLLLTPRQSRVIRYLILRDKMGLGMLDPIVSDEYVEDISCSGMGRVFVEHKIFHSLKTVISFSDYEELDMFVMRLAERIRKPVSVHNPIVDATLPDGSRINIVFGRDVSKRGSNFTIRKFSQTPLSIIELIDMGTLDFMMAAYLSLLLSEGMNVFVCGETASGKTTTLNALTTFIQPNAKIVSIEDTPELQVPHQNWIREVVRSGKEDDSGVTMFDLLKAALRQRPNEIIIGEIRGAEGAIAFQAMQTGHSVMATFHASSVEALLQRLTGDPINVPKNYMDNLNLAVIQSAVKLPSGKVGRRMVSINEIVGYDPIAGSFTFIEAFKWDPVTDTFQFTGHDNSYLMEYKIAPKLSIPAHKKRRIYVEIERRAKILEKLSKQGVTDFYELLKVLSKAQREGLF
jgi:flagellar protein FlaI